MAHVVKNAFIIDGQIHEIVPAPSGTSYVCGYCSIKERCKNCFGRGCFIALFHENGLSVLRSIFKKVSGNYVSTD